MSISGKVGPPTPHRREDTSQSLDRLRYPDNVTPAELLEFDGFILGAVNGSPLWAGEGLAAGFDGTLYQRASLLQQLALAPDANDAEIAAKAYLRWGPTFPDHLEGEFSVAVWVDRERELLLARDPLKRGQMLYAPVADGFCFATEWLALSGWPGVDDALDEEVIGRALSIQPSGGRTLYRGILNVPAGVMHLRAGSAPRVEPYWFPLRQSRLHVRDWREYGDALHAAMLRAVEVRLPADGRVGSQLSSGFDSSGVSALVAQVLLRQNRPLVCYTSVPTQRVDAHAIVENRFDDEWPLASQVAAMYPNIEHVRIPTDSADWWEALDTMSDVGGWPPSFIRNARWYHGILRDAQTRGLVSMFEGQAGNLTASYNGSFGLYDLRQHGQWLSLARAIRDRRAQGERWPGLVHGAWMPSARIKSVVQRLRGRKMPELFELTLMRRDFYEASGIPQRTLSAMGSLVEGDRTSGSSWRLSILEAGDFGAMNAVARRAFGLRREDPTADRRLIELCLSIPDEAFAPNGMRRELYRYAFRNDLPAELLNQRGRGLQCSDFLQLFEQWLPEWARELDRLEGSSIAAKVFDLPRMRRMLEDWPRIVAGNRAHADQLYNYTFGGGMALARTLRRYEERRAERPASHS